MRAAPTVPQSTHQTIEEGLRCHLSGDLAAADRLYRDALSAEPENARAMYLLGSLLLQGGHVEQAAEKLEKAIAADPEEALAHFDLGLTWMQLGRLSDAQTSLHETIRLKPDYAAAYVHLGLIQEKLGQMGEAETTYRTAIEIDSANPDAQICLSGLLAKTDQLAEAERLLQDVIAKHPQHLVALVNLTTLLIEQERLTEARPLGERAIEIAPDNPDALTNWGLILAADERYDEAEVIQAKASRLAPTSARILNHLGLAILSQDRIDDAISVFERAREYEPESVMTGHNIAYAQFCKRDYAAAWQNYEGSFEAGVRMPNRVFNVPRWRGPNDSTSKLLVWREQGLGDEITFAAAYPDVCDVVASTVIECDPRLIPLFRRSFPKAEVYAEGTAPQNKFDAHVPQGSLGLYFRPTPESFPSNEYLVPDPDRVAEFKERLSALGPKPKIGINWTSGLITSERRHWFTSLRDWDPLLQRNDIDIVCLQYGDTAKELDDVMARIGRTIHVLDDLDLRNDIDGLAALSVVLDGAIGTPGASLTLAAACGTAVIQIRRTPEPMFYEDSLGSRTIVRKAWKQRWPDAIAKVAEALDELLKERAGHG